MITIKLKRTGGFMGKSIESTRILDISEDVFIKKLTKVASTENVAARDDFNHSITINGSKTFLIDMALLKGSLKKIIEGMEDELKSE
jgi:hypothetical protein